MEKNNNEKKIYKTKMQQAIKNEVATKSNKRLSNFKNYL